MSPENTVRRERRLAWTILIPALMAMVAGFLVSFVFIAKYTSQSLVLVEAAKIPDVVVQQVFTEDLTQHITMIQQRVLSPSQLRPMVERLGLVKGSQSLDDVVNTIQLNMTIQPVVTELSSIGPGGKKEPGQSPLPGFYVNFTAPTAREAQQICTDLTSMLLEEDLKSRQDATQGTMNFLTRQLERAKESLMDLGVKRANLKKQRGRESMSPDIEEQYKVLAIEYDSAQKNYEDLLAKKHLFELASQAEEAQEEEQMVLLTPASLPDSPEFPNRLLFAAVGLCTGLVLGLGLAQRAKLRRKANEAPVNPPLEQS